MPEHVALVKFFECQVVLASRIQLGKVGGSLDSHLFDSGEVVRSVSQHQ